MKTSSILVIGAGIGGITAATHLARQGFKVTVVEKNSNAGGRCDRLSRDGHHFDTGPTLLIMPLLYEAEFRALGSSLDQMLNLQRVDPTYRLIFEDGSQLNLTSDMNSMQEQIETFETGSFQGFLRYLDEGCRHYSLGIERIVNRDFREASDFFALRNLPLLYQLKPLVNHHHNMSAYFDDPRLKAAFTFQDMYMGLRKDEAPATFSLLPYSELVHGVWYPNGGMYRIVEKLMELARESGVEFLFDSAVQQIEVIGKQASGLILKNGQWLGSDVILANADLPYVYQKLLPDRNLSTQLEHKKYSASVISYFWGIDKTYDTLGPHTLFLPDDPRERVDARHRNRDWPGNQGLYIHAPARLDPTMAPAGQDTLTAIVPVGHLGEMGEQDWGKFRDEIRQKIFNRLARWGIKDLEAHIKFETTFTPPSWRARYNLVNGSTHGLSHNLTQMGYFRPPNRHPRYPNLYFTGASTHPGTGIPTAMISGRLAAKRIEEEYYR